MALAVRRIAGLLAAGSLFTCISLYSKNIQADTEQITLTEWPAEQKVRLRFCYEDKQLLPYYSGSGQHVPERPGASVEHLQRIVGRTRRVILELERYPWLRCQSRLQNAEADAIIAGYHPDRDRLGIYPRFSDSSVDYNRAISHHGNCLVRRHDADEQELLEQLTIARPHGYAQLDMPEDIAVVEADSQESAYRLTESGRVNATTTLCMVNGIKGEDPVLHRYHLKVMYPPLTQSSGFLVFSQTFYEKYTELAELLWASMPQYKQEDAEVYYDYLYYHRADITPPCDNDGEINRYCEAGH
ncbi:amino acid ABC transporter [Chromatiaceae bacterium AAb-1]|nr:amino acid ABC transporter [Chromatiaceae bacterium AAb-1]